MIKRGVETKTRKRSYILETTVHDGFKLIRGDARHSDQIHCGGIDVSGHTVAMKGDQISILFMEALSCLWERERDSWQEERRDETRINLSSREETILALIWGEDLQFPI
jgi:hypothetical protein